MYAYYAIQKLIVPICNLKCICNMKYIRLTAAIAASTADASSGGCEEGGAGSEPTEPTEPTEPSEPGVAGPPCGGVTMAPKA